jgi:hypothetical protein
MPICRFGILKLWPRSLARYPLELHSVILGAGGGGSDMEAAPEVEDLTWKWESQAVSDRFGVLWRLWSLTFSTCLQPLGHTQLPNNSESQYLQLKHHRVGTLSLNLETNVRPLLLLSCSFPMPHWTKLVCSAGLHRRCGQDL